MERQGQVRQLKSGICKKSCHYERRYCCHIYPYRRPFRGEHRFHNYRCHQLFLSLVIATSLSVIVITFFFHHH